MSVGVGLGVGVGEGVGVGMGVGVGVGGTRAGVGRGDAPLGGQHALHQLLHDGEGIRHCEEHKGVGGSEYDASKRARRDASKRAR